MALFNLNSPVHSCLKFSAVFGTWQVCTWCVYIRYIYIWIVYLYLYVQVYIYIHVYAVCDYVCVSMYVYSCTFFTKNTQISAYLRYSKCLCFWRVFSPYNRNCTTLSILPLSAFWSEKKSEDGHERARFLAQVSTKSRNEHKFKQKLLQAGKKWVYCKSSIQYTYHVHYAYIFLHNTSNSENYFWQHGWPR